MATVTPNFNWPVPTSTDLVKDGATAIEALGDSIDASLLDLKGGTSGQVLAKNSNTDMDFVWVAQDDSNAIQNTIVDAKGDLIAATAADTPARLAVGTNGQVLVADSTAATGIKWAAPSSGAMTLIKRATVSNVADTGTTFDNMFSSSYSSYYIVFEDLGSGTTAADFHFQFRYAGPTTQASAYYQNRFALDNESATQGYTNVANGTQALLNTTIGAQNSERSRGNMFVFGCRGQSERPVFNAFVSDGGQTIQNMTYGTLATARTYTGFICKASTDTLYGTISVYGLAVA